MARKYYYGMSRKSTKNADQFINGLFKIGKSMAVAYEREAKRQQREQARKVAAYNRLVAQSEREQARQIRQHETAMRRAEREREKAERERERAAKLQARMEQQQRLEDEMAQIEEDNDIWRNVHSFVEHVITLEEVNENINRCNFERQNHVPDGFFEIKYPTDSLAKQQALNEANRKYDINKVQKEYLEANKVWSDMKFEDVEPTTESVTEELTAEAKEKISAFLPWKQSKLRKAYVDERLDARYKELHDAWLSKKNKYESMEKAFSAKAEEKNRIATEMRQAKKDYITNRTRELFEAEVESWKQEKEDFYANLLQSLQNVIDGDRDYVITAIGSLFTDDELPMEYFVDYAYEEEKGKVMIDLDLPEIEDLPDRKIVLTPTGKKSIRMKGQTDLRSDYAHCVFGLAMYVAHLVFNVSLKVQEIEISGYTQRKEANSAIATDQYLFVVSFTRDLFSQIDFSRLSSLQVMDFFQRYFNMTKSFDMKQIDLATAYDRMESFTPADYQAFIATLPPVKEEPVQNPVPSINSVSSPPTVSHIEDTPYETYEKADRFMKGFYSFIDRLSKDSCVNLHAGNLKNVNIRFTSGDFTGDGDVRTYRGKLFFCSLIDLYRSLEKMKVNIDVFSSSCYAFVLFVIKIYMKEEAQYSMLSKYEQVFHSYIEMLKPMIHGIPTPSHFYLIGEVLSDYEKNMSWYQQYLDFMEQHIKIVEASIQGGSYTLKYVKDFFKFHHGLVIGSPNYNSPTVASPSTDVNQTHLDPLFKEAAKLIVASQQGSTSMIQRKFTIGYNRASRLMDQLEAMGIVGHAKGSQPREVLIVDEKSLNELLSKL